jgi:hypothetical protein
MWPKQMPSYYNLISNPENTWDQIFQSAQKGDEWAQHVVAEKNQIDRIISNTFAYERSIQDEEERRVCSLMKEFALKNGWPEDRIGCDVYQLDSISLKNIPGSFYDSGPAPEDCPMPWHAYRAFVDRLPALLEQGHDQKYLAYGYGPEHYVITQDEQSANNLTVMEYLPYQMMYVKFQISESHFEEPFVRDYAAWKLENGL